MGANTAALEDAALVIAGRAFHSRLIVGTGKYRDNRTMVRAHAASGAEIVTVAVRRVDLDRTKEEGILYHLDPERYFLLANTAGCYTADDAVRYARLAREAGFNEFIKLEVIGDEETLFPDVEQLLAAASELVANGFVVLPYCNDDPVTARKLQDIGCAAVMPLGAPIGSGMGIRNPYNIEIIRDMCQIPVIVDAGVGTASDATLAMELGFDGVMLNEHHDTAFCMGSVMNVEASILARITKEVKIVLLGNPLPIVGNPLRLAEELAMIRRALRGATRCRPVAAQTRTVGRPSSATCRASFP